MKLSKKWLQDYITLPEGLTDKAFADAMTMSGSKVEGFAPDGAELKNIVVGLVTSIERHPDSDHLWVCQLDVGTETVQIVTGAQNVTQGSYVPVAKDNSTLADGKKIKKTKFRGVLSQGMLCGIDEIGLTLHDFPYGPDDGIFLLGEDCARTPGLDIHEAVGLDDVVTEFEITSNRPDCLSVVGLAREAAATFKLPFAMPEPVLPAGHGDVNGILRVRIDAPDLCYRYAGAVVENVRVAPSPRWMRERLRAAGVRAINNIVDITNYVMLEYGQPMHAFDLRFLEGNQVVVRQARKGESITTLDGTRHALASDMLVIADAKKPVAVAGVMGGEYSGIMEDTRTVVFESACFYGLQVRATAKRLGLRTESSARYEKELDPGGCLRSLARALQFIEELDAGDVVSGAVDVFPTPKSARAIPFDPAWVNQFIGIGCPAEEQIAILERLGCAVNPDSSLLTPPSWRGDLAEKADIAEEVARLYGFDKIPSALLRGLADARLTEAQQLQRQISETLRALGCSEICTYSFISPRAYDKICLPEGHALRNSVVIKNPLGEDTSVMRTTALPSLLETLARNYNNRNESAALFELATVYRPRGEGKLPLEKQKIMIGLYGPGADFFTLKGIVEELLAQVGIADYDVTAYTNEALHPGRAAKIWVDGCDAALLGEVSPAVQENYEIGVRTYIASLDFNTILEKRNPVKIYRQLPRYPAVTRDLALVCGAQTPVLALQNTIKKAAGELLEHLRLFDVYTGSQIAEGQKSVAFSLRLRSARGTLTDEEADAAVKRCVKALEKIGAALRG